MNREEIETINLLISKFMGVEYCKCCDDGWDGVSRSLHANCKKCAKPHTTNLACQNKYTNSIESYSEVWNKLLRDYGIKVETHLISEDIYQIFFESKCNAVLVEYKSKDKESMVHAYARATSEIVDIVLESYNNDRF
jgi:hypothetical protein